MTYSQKFSRFAEECKSNSPLYNELCKQIAEDEYLLQLCRVAREGQPVPNLLLASVHFFVLQHKESDLAAFYPSVTGQPSAAIPFAVFKAFVKEYEQGIIELLETRIVQTNVLTRCNYILPAIASVLSKKKGPVTVIDIGCSAGLNINFDQYEYYHDGHKVYGDSPVKIHCHIKGKNMPVITPVSNTLTRIGIDQNIISLDNADDLLWLQSLIWPDQMERFTMQKNALALPALKDIQLVQASSVGDFRRVIDTVPADQILIVYVTHALYQFPDQLLNDFYAMLDAVGQERELYFISAESTPAMKEKWNVKEAAVVLTSYKNNTKVEKLIAEANSHGNWMKWK